MNLLLEKRKKAWMGPFLCVFCTILRERNRKVFDNCECFIKQLKILSCIIFGVKLDCILGMVLCCYNL